MKFKHLLALALAACSVSVAMADLPYRAHRYESFMGTPPPAEEGKQIVFLGNSITNMHNWTEAFGSDPNVVNRGNSGGYASELIEELESFIHTKPAKIFIGIGTNDIATHYDVNRYILDMEILVKRIHIASPKTEVYVQSILPRSSGSHSYNVQANAILAQKAAEWGFTFIDLSTVMAGVRTSPGTTPATSWACDGLHPTGIGYRAWTKHIKDYVNGQWSYSEGGYHPNLGVVTNPSRVSQFSLLPVASNDILFVGDEMVENGEWNELLRIPNIKKRANGYGHGGVGVAPDDINNDNAMTSSLGMLRASLETDKNTQHAPKQIIIYSGVWELVNSTVDVFKTRYQNLVNYITTNYPDTKILGVSIMDVNGFDTEAQDYKPQRFNEFIQELAAKTPNMQYCDIYTTMKENKANSMNGNYVTGRGYVRIANELAKYIDGANPVTLTEFEEYYANRTIRRELGKKYNAAYKAIATGEFGSEVGGYTELVKANLEKALEDMAAALAKETVTQAQYDALVAEVDDALKGEGSLVFPTVAEGKFYRLTSYRGSHVLGVNGTVLNGMAATTNTTGNDVWRFLPREDGKIDIVSLDGHYIVPFTGSTSVSVSVSETQPEYGWQFGVSDAAARTICIYAVKPDGTGCQLNTANVSGNPCNVWNWGYNIAAANGGNPNSYHHNDQGCAFYFDEFTGTYINPNQTGLSGGTWKQFKLVTNPNNNGRDQGKLLSNFQGIVRNSSSGAGYYAVEYVNESALGTTPASSYFYVVPNADNTSWTVTLPDGYYLNANGLEQNTSASVTVSEQADGTFAITKWVPWDLEGHAVSGTFSSAVVANYAVTSADMSQYDTWHVTIDGVTAGTGAAKEIGNNLSVTLGNNKSRGLATVFNNGTFFVDKGVQITANDLTVGGNTAAQTGDLRVKVNPELRTIDVKYVSTNGKWYQVKNISSTKYPTIGVNQVLTTLATGMQTMTGGGKGCYDIQLLDESAITSNPEISYLLIEETAANTWNVKMPNGHYLNATALASVPSVNVTATLNATTGYYAMAWCPYTSSGKNILGAFSGSSGVYERTEVDVTGYDIWQVEIVNEVLAATGVDYAIGNNLKVILPAAKVHGLDRVYNGGYFFTDKGTQLSAADVTMGGNTAAQATATPEITVNNADHTITVDYTIKLTDLSIDVTEKTLRVGETLQINASTQPADVKCIPAWSSTDPKIASVNVAGFVTALAPGKTQIVVEAGLFSTICKIEVIPALPSELYLNQKEAILLSGETAQLSVFSNPTEADMAGLTWTSGNAAVATVDSTGKVTAVAAGETTITATVGEVSISCVVKVQAVKVASVTLNKTEITLSRNATETLVATVGPANADDKTVTWASDNEAVATVDQNGKVTAVGPGEATITATAGTITAECTVTSLPVEVTTIALSQSNVNLEIGQSATIEATVGPDNADDKTVTWTSSEPTIVRVNSEGKVTAIAAGEAVITATAGSQTATCAVKVTTPVVAVTGISLNKNTLSLVEGESDALVASVVPANADDKTVNWTSSNENVATVDAAGTITAIAPGTATITATSAAANGISASCTVTVVRKTIHVASVTLDATEKEIMTGDEFTLTATVAPANADNPTVAWTSSDETVAKVDANGKVTGVGVGTATITATADGRSASCSVRVNFRPVEVTSITLDRTSIVLLTGESYSIVATVNPANATEKDLTWKSSNEDVVSVDAQGNIFAKAEGTATITATAGNGVEATCAVTVSHKVVPVEVVILSDESLNLLVGETSALVATVGPANADDKTLVWTSSDENVATVDASGTVTAMGAGTATITATAVNGVKATCTVKVSVPVVPVSGISISATALTINEGETATIVATVSPANATDKTVVWTSDNEAVATVDQNGKVTALAPGTAVITAAVGNYSESCTVTVVRSCTGLELSAQNVTLWPGFTEQLTATVTPEDTTDAITWSSSDESVATVDATGLVTAVAEGTATITATCGDKTATCTITVVKHVIAASGISLSETALSLDVNETATLVATVEPANATDKTVTWSSSNEAVATVDATGVVTAIAAGNAVITATCGDKSASCTVTVTEPYVDPTPEYVITISQTEVTLKPDETVHLVAVTKPAGGVITWSSSVETVATVDDKGNVTALAPGVTTIKATCGEAEATCLIIVEEIVEDGIYSIQALKAAGDVYDLVGRKVTNPTRGRFYIVNGHKVLTK